MKDFRSCMDKISSLRFIAEEVVFCSSLGYQAMLSAPWLTVPEQISEHHSRIARYLTYLNSKEQSKGLEELEIELSALVNVSGSIQLLRKPKSCCTDIDFFELKKLSLIEHKCRRIAEKYGFVLSEKPSLEKVLGILDPEGELLPTFFLSGAFEQELTRLRKAQEAATTDEEMSRLADEVAKLEDLVRARLTEALRPYADQLEAVLEALAEDDHTLGKAKWALQHGDVQPIVQVDGETILEEVRNPMVEHALRRQGDAFQPVSVTFGDYPTLITGANMAGKSVLLSSVALIQALTQLGWYVPATRADIVLVDDVMLSMGDGQDSTSGLSSFGAEMLRLNEIIQAVKKGRKILALIDEPARSTNPEEGHALVNGLVKLLEKYQVRTLITTHYSNISGANRRWRVRGFIEEKMSYPLSVNQLNRCIDYTLEEDKAEEVPREALRIAEILGVDSELLDLSRM